MTENEFIDESGILELAKAILKTVGNLKLIGETGVGKTRLVHELPKMLSCELYEIVLGRDTTRYDLLTSDVLKNGTTEQRDGLVIQWLKNPNGGIMYLDGFNYAESSILSFIESISDFRGSVYVPEYSATFTRTAKHYIIISYNPTEKSGYSGTNSVNIATLRRFEGLEVTYLSELKEIELIKGICNNYDFAAKIVQLANKTRDLYRKGTLRMPLTTGNLINYAKLSVYGLPDNDIIKIASSMYIEEEHELFSKLAERDGEMESLVNQH